MKLKIPIILAGLPLPSTENPYLATPVETLEVDILVEERCESKINKNPIKIDRKISDPSLRSLLQSYTHSLLSSLGENLCITIELLADNKAPITSALPPSGIYDALTTGIMYSVAYHYGEVLDTFDLLSTARIHDTYDLKFQGWEHAIDALRYSVLTGKTVVFRNDEEFGEISDPLGIKYVYQKTLNVLKPSFDVEDLGTDTYGALTHLIGVSVLEAAVRAREMEPSSMDPLLNLLKKLSTILWEFADSEQQSCVGRDILLSSGLPGQFECGRVNYNGREM
jgi:hypothetical protein